MYNSESKNICQQTILIAIVRSTNNVKVGFYRHEMSLAIEMLLTLIHCAKNKTPFNENFVNVIFRKLDYVKLAQNFRMIS